MTKSKMTEQNEALRKELDLVKLEVSTMKSLMEGFHFKMDLIEGFNSKMDVLTDFLQKGKGKGTFQPPESSLGHSGEGSVHPQVVKETGEVSVRPMGTRDSSDWDRYDMRFRKLELPVFMGEDPEGWVFHVERYFRCNRVNEEEKLLAISVCLEGRALHWYLYKDANSPFRSWVHFKESLIRRFKGPSGGGRYEALMSIRQTTTVDDYNDRFELLMARVPDAPEEVLMDAYTNGLRRSVQAEMRLRRPASLQEMMEEAMLVEARNLALFSGPGAKVGPTKNKVGGGLKFESNKLAKVSLSSPNDKWNKMANSGNSGGKEGIRKEREVVQGGDSGRRENHKRLSLEEEQYKREKGLYFHCPEKFFPGHKCKNGQLQLLLAGVEEEAEEFVDTNEELLAKDESDDPAVNITMNAMVGFSDYKAMLLKGHILDREVLPRERSSHIACLSPGSILHYRFFPHQRWDINKPKLLPLWQPSMSFCSQLEDK